MNKRKKTLLSFSSFYISLFRCWILILKSTLEPQCSRIMPNRCHHRRVAASILSRVGQEFAAFVYHRGATLIGRRKKDGKQNVKKVCSADATTGRPF